MLYPMNLVSIFILIGILLNSNVLTSPLVTNPSARPGSSLSSTPNIPKPLPGNSGGTSSTLKPQIDDTEPDDPSSDLDNPSQGTNPEPKPDLYPDLNQCRQRCQVAAGKSVFYSQVGPHEDKPQRFAESIQGVLVRESYPPHFTDKNDAWSGYPRFMQRASQAFAEKTTGTAYVLLPTDGMTDLRRRVWTRFEKPFLIQGQTDRILKVDPDDFTKKCVLYLRGGGQDPQYPNCNSEVGPIPPAQSADALYIK